MKKFLAYYQIIGGAIGVFTAIIALKENVFNIAVLIGLLLFIISVIAGIYLLKEDNKLGSYINFALQVFFFNFYQYFTVAAVTMYFTSDLNIGGDLEIASNFKLNIDDENSRFLFGINLVALFLLFQLHKIKEPDNSES